MRGLSLLLLASYSDQNVETALQVAFRAIPADCRVPFLTIPAVDALTPMDITADGLDAYARRYTDGTNGYEAQAPQRGVVVQVVNNKSFDCGLRMARHFVFVLFESGREVPQCDAGYRGRFYELKRLVDTLWSTNQYRLSTELLKQNLTKGSNPPRYHQSLACEFLGVPDSLGSKPDRVTRAAAITRIGIIMSGYESFLEFPEPATKDNSKRQRLLPPPPPLPRRLPPLPRRAAAPPPRPAAAPPRRRRRARRPPPWTPSSSPSGGSPGTRRTARSSSSRTS